MILLMFNYMPHARTCCIQPITLLLVIGMKLSKHAQINAINYITIANIMERRFCLATKDNIIMS